jgi:hypothetical protein
MSSQSDTNLEERMSRAAKAKNAMLAKFKRAVDPENPATIEKRRQREAIVSARTERLSQRETARQEHERELALQAALAAEAAEAKRRSAAEQATREAAAEAEREAVLKVEQKAVRDARYAARKVAKKERRRGY